MSYEIIGQHYVVQITNVKNSWDDTFIPHPIYACERGTDSICNVLSAEMFIFDSIDEAKKSMHREDYCEQFAEAKFTLIEIIGKELKDG